MTVSPLNASASGASAQVAGIVAMIGAMACFIVSDIFCKLATENLAASQVIAVRGIFSTAIFIIPAAVFGYLRLVRTSMSKAWATRIGGEIIAAVSFIPALAHMPIANLTSIVQTIPLAMTAGGAIFLGEKVGIRRWTATIIGFLGVLLIIQPGTSSFSWWSIAGLICVCGVVLRDLATRRMDKAVPPVLLTATTAAGVTIAGAVMGLVDAPWVMPSPRQLAYLFCAATAVASGYYLSIIAVQRTELSAVAPFRYSIIPMAVVAGIVIWGEQPSATTLIGIAIIIATGVYTFIRERQLARAK